MRHLRRGLVLAVCLLASIRPVSADPWVVGAYVFFEEAPLPYQNIDMRGITHLLYFSLIPTKKGGLVATTDPAAVGVPSVAHGAGKLALVSIGGGDAQIYAAFSSAITPTYQAAFVQNIVNWVQANNYDGVDLDLEPIQQKDVASYASFMIALSTALKNAAATSANPNALLTADIAVEESAPPAAFVGDSTANPPVPSALSSLDQVNLETYDLSGNYPGWVTWHDSCVYTNGQMFPAGGPLPSTDVYVQQWIANGIPAGKLSVGIDSQGFAWPDATAPEQKIPLSVHLVQYDYSQIIQKFYSPAAYHYDTGVKAPYLSLPHDFVSYTDPQLCADKVAYVQSNGLHGLLVWQIESQAMPDGSQPLLEAVNTAMGNVGATVAIQEPAGTTIPDGSTFDVGVTPLTFADPVTFTIVNTGTTTVTDLAVTVMGTGGASAFTVGPPGSTTLAGGASTTFRLTFFPGSTGKAVATVSVTGTDLPYTDSIVVSGTAVDFHEESGFYAGTFGSNNTIKMTVTTTGAFTASMSYNGETIPFHGRLNDYYNGTVGAATVPVSLLLAINGFGSAPGDATLTGTIGGINVTAYHAEYKLGQRAVEAGRYSVLLDPTQTGTTSVPYGISYGSLLVSTTGSATLVGHLADGSVLSAGGPLVGGDVSQNQLVVSQKNSVFQLAGSISSIARTAYAQVGGSLGWTKNASKSAYYGSGFSTALNVTGGPYSAPKPNVMALGFPSGTANALLEITDGPGGRLILDSAVTLTPQNKVIDVPTSSADFKFVINVATGAFSGSCLDSTTTPPKTIHFGGLLNQDSGLNPYGAGYYLDPVSAGTALSGQVTFTSN